MKNPMTTEEITPEQTSYSISEDILSDALLTAFHVYPMQHKKAMQHIKSGALICGLEVQLNVPHKGKCTIDQHGRVIWRNDK